MYIILRGYIFFLLLCVSWQQAFAQKSQVDITNADVMTSKKINGESVRVLKGNVGFRQEGVEMHCDSAYFFDTRNSFTAFGNISISQNDSMNMYGGRLDYDGNKKYAIIKENVSLTDHQMTLNTDRLDYDMAKRVAFYLNGGSITDGKNNLTSRHGYYYSKSRDLFFKTDVVLNNPDYSMNCDTLQYNIISHKATFLSPTTIHSKNDIIYCESGWYNTHTNLAQFGKNAYLKSGHQYLFGDSLFYDRNRAFGKAVKNIRVIDTLDRLLVTGQYAEHYQNSRKTFITEEVLLTKGFKKDSVYMTADTLRSEYDSSGTRRIMKAYYRVRVYNRQFQAGCDSLVYSYVDSTMNLYREPVFWFGTYQATADHIKVLTRKNTIDKAYLTKDAFIISPEDSMLYNQIKGRDMTAYFANNEMNRVKVDGNGQAMYFIRDEKKAYIGVNTVNSSYIDIGVTKSKVNRVKFYPQSDGKLTPMKDMALADLKLAGFKYRIEDQPKSLDDLKAFAKINTELLKPLPRKQAPKKKNPVKKEKGR